MASELNSVNDILNKIRNELNNQLTLGKNMDTKIDPKMLWKQSSILREIVLTSKISEEDQIMLRKFSLTLQKGQDAKSLRYEKQDLERILCNLKN